MSPQQPIEDLVVEAARMLDVGEVASYEGAPAWRLRTAEDVEVLIEFDPAESRIVITSRVSEEVLADAGAALHRLHQLMLLYNHRWTETGGLRFALDGAPGRAVLMLELNTTALAAARLCSVLSNMREVVMAWRQMLRSFGVYPQSR